MVILPGQIHLVHHYPSGKDRPVVVVSREELNRGSFVLVTPFTTRKIEDRRKQLNWAVIEQGTCVLDRTSACAGDNLSELALIDFVKYLGLLPDVQMEIVKDAIRYSMDL